METALRVTDQPQESSFFDMLSGDNVLAIPLFQRHYRWQQRNLEWLWNDIIDIKDGAAVSCGEIAEAIAGSVLDELEGFLFRRAVCGIEPTGLHAVFKGLWSDLTESTDAGIPPPGITAESFGRAIKSKPTISWPNDAEFATAIKNSNLYDRKVVKFALLEYELAREGESPADDFELEHIAPQTETDYWKHLFGERYHELVNTWANLIPLTGRMNKSASQAPFDEKRGEYSNSIFATTREIAETYTAWTPESADVRAAEIVKWALTRWSNAGK